MSAQAPSDQPDVTDDTLLGGRVLIRQPKEGYRVAIDPVLLAAAVKAKAAERLLDVGCGTGAAMFCLAARIANIDISGLEIQPSLAALATEGLKLNNLETRARIIVGDLAALPDIICAYPFDVVMTNPPFGADGTVSPKASVATAHHESDVDLAQWIHACLKLLMPDRLGAIMAPLTPSCGDIQIYPIFPKAGQPAKRVIIDAGKDRKTGETLHAGLVLQSENGDYTARAEAILRRAEAI